MLYWILGILGGLIGLVIVFALVVTVVGTNQPKTHVAARSLEVKQTPEAIWAVITDHASEPAWQPYVQSVKRMPDRDGREVWEVKYKGAGNPPMTLATTEKAPARRMVRTIDDAKKVFSGRWEFEIATSNGGSRVTITEHGEIPNPFFRGMWRLFSNPTMYIDMYLKALAGKFGEPPVIE